MTHQNIELKNIVPEYYSKNPLVRWLFVKRLEVAINMAQIDNNAEYKALDIGCGEGRLLSMLNARYPNMRLWGIDNNPNIAALSIAGANIQFGDISKPFSVGEQEFHRVFCLDVLEHILEMEAPLGFIKKVMAPGGLLIISAPTESIFYKLGRFLTKGTFSAISGPGAGPHYYNSTQIIDRVKLCGFMPLACQKLPLPGFFSAIEILSFRKIGSSGFVVHE